MNRCYANPRGDTAGQGAKQITLAAQGREPQPRASGKRVMDMHLRLKAVVVNDACASRLRARDHALIRRVGFGPDNGDGRVVLQVFGETVS